jgi:hypothetical protein
MIMISAPHVSKGHHHDYPPEASREYAALKATALDARKFPILAKHWPGVLIVGDKLAVNENCDLRLPKGVRYD